MNLNEFYFRSALDRTDSCCIMLHLQAWIDTDAEPEICHTTTCCNTWQHTATIGNTLQHTATHGNTLQHTATHGNTLQHTATHGNTLQHTATHGNTRQHTATHGNTLQHTATHCNTRQHTVNLLQFCLSTAKSVECSLFKYSFCSKCQDFSNTSSWLIALGCNLHKAELSSFRSFVSY